MPAARLSSQDILARLIAFDTTSSLSNLNLIHWVRDYLDGYGVSSQLIYDETGGKANLHAVVGPADQPGIVLSGHTDVVPVEGQSWTSDPFVLREHNGHLYGRGACDMKGFIAAALARAPDLAAAQLKTPVHFALSYDEETGCRGAQDLARHIAALPVRPTLCIVGEPTMMTPVTGHKGIVDFTCRVHGREAHSSLAPYAVNAVENAAELMAHIGAQGRRLAEQGPFNRQFDPPCTTLQVGMVRGGTAINIVPSACEFSFEIRSIPEMDGAALAEEIRQHAFRHLEPRMKAVDPTTGFEFRLVADIPAFDIGDSHPAVAFVQSLSGANQTSRGSFATEAGIFQQVGGVPTVVCGPGHIAQAHKPDEFITLDQLMKCESFLDRLVDQLRF